MVRGRKSKKADLSSEELKSHILQVARKHFAKRGYDGLSLKDVAAEAEIANSLINYHFQDKEGLFLAVIEPFAQQSMEVIRRILSEPQNLDEFRVRIELFVEEMQASMMADKDGFEIIDREMKSGNPIILKVFENTFLKTFKIVIGFISQAQSNGLLNKELDPMILSSFLFNCTCDAIHKDFLAKRFFNVTFENPEWRKKYARHVAAVFLKGVVS